ITDPVSDIKSSAVRWGIRLFVLAALIGSVYFISTKPGKTQRASDHEPVPALVVPAAGTNQPASKPPRQPVVTAIDDHVSFIELVSYVSTLLAGLAGIHRYGIKPCWEFTQRLKTAFTHIERMSIELKPNGGGSLYDIIKRIERQTVTAIERHRALIDSLHIIRFESSAKGQCEWVSSAYMELTGLSQEQAQGNGWISAVHLDDRAKVVGEWQSCMQQQRTFLMTYRLINVTTNDVHDVACVGKPILQNDVIVGYVGTITPLIGTYATKYADPLKIIK
ncbi:MAG: PAS domain-containing protein, partial [Nitrosomonadaceae bacterium]|nr:PAS domain-containing protein [Nitrosomonadaceae bacterium]